MNYKLNFLSFYLFVKKLDLDVKQIISTNILNLEIEWG